MQPLERIVELHNDGEEQFVGMWDSKKIVIKAGGSRDMMAGVADHLIERHADIPLRIEEIETEETEARTPVNPLEQTDRGTAFNATSKKKKAETATTSDTSAEVTE